MAKKTNVPKEWRLLAEEDMAVVGLAVNRDPPLNEPAAFHCQQAVEKYLKGVLVVLGEEPPHTHDLTKLRLLAEKHRPAFSAISIPCSTLSRYSVIPRYDFDLRCTSDTDMCVILQLVQEIKGNYVHESAQFFRDPSRRHQNAEMGAI